MSQGGAEAAGERKDRDQTAFSWAVTAPFFSSPHDRWISSFVESDRHQFRVVPSTGTDVNWHTKKSAQTGLGEWRAHARTAGESMRWAAEREGGVITVFPQLAVAAASRKRARRLDVPLVSWFFNTNFGRDVRSFVARPVLRNVDRFVVHSTREIGAYAEQLRLPADRFCFVPIQYGGEVQTDPESETDPFVFATGSGARDYETFFTAMSRLGVPAKVVAGPRVLAGLHPPSNVEILDDVSRSDIHRLVRRARVNVVPMHEGGLTGGIITMAEAFRHGRGLVVTDRPGIDDYVEHDHNALLVPLRDPDAMAEAITAMFSDESLRRRLGENAAALGRERHTDEAAARSLTRVLDEVLAGRQTR